MQKVLSGSRNKKSRGRSRKKRSRSRKGAPLSSFGRRKGGREEAHLVCLRFLKREGHKQTGQRYRILDHFLHLQEHLTSEEIYYRVKEENPRIGFSTVQRTLKLLADCGLARILDFGDGVMRFESSYGQMHHDHMICRLCGRSQEFSAREIEKLQQREARRHRFRLERHRLVLYGICAECQKRGTGRRQKEKEQTRAG